VRAALIRVAGEGPLLIDRSLPYLAGALRSGEVRAEDLVEQAIAAHEGPGRDLGAYIAFDAEQAISQARRADELMAKDHDPGPLCGLPVSVKDLYGVEGFGTYAGTRRQLPSRWEREGFLVRQLRSQGAVIIGKTHTVELAFGGVGTNPHHGTPTNPWDAETHRVPGGSSAGAGVSIQEGSAVIALGTDTGGSIRIPASATGTVGQKLSAGRWPTSGVVPLSSTLDTVGGLTRTVRDAAWFFHAIETGNTESTTRRIEDAEALCLADLRIRVPDSSLWRDCQTDIARVLELALRELESQGATLVHGSGALMDSAIDQYMDGGIAAAECSEFLQADLNGWMEIIDQTVAMRLEVAADMAADRYIRTLRHRRVAIEEFEVQTTDVDLVALPSLTLTPPTMSQVEDPDDYQRINRQMLSSTCPVNWLGACALSIPVGLDRSGMPVGLQLVGLDGEDEKLLAWGLAVEKALGTSPSRIGPPPRIIVS